MLKYESSGKIFNYVVPNFAVVSKCDDTAICDVNHDFLLPVRGHFC